MFDILWEFELWVLDHILRWYGLMLDPGLLQACFPRAPFPSLLTSEP